MEQTIIEILGPLLEKYPFIFATLAAVGAFRLFFKPLMSGIEAAVKETPSTKDDEILGKVQGNVFYKAFVFLVDLFGSIKLPKK
jgi:hypothetical protein